MNYGLIFRLLSLILGAIAAAFLLCAGVAWFFSGTTADDVSFRGFSISAAAAVSLAIGFAWMSRGASTRFFRKEALSVIGLGWLLASAVGSLPYVLIAPELGVAGAIFESASGLTTTGASVISDIEALPRSLLFWRALSQWIGGMGVVVFFVAVLSFLGAGAKVLYANEASGSTADFEESRVQKAVLHLLWIYLGLSAVCAVTFRLLGMDWYEALCHMFTTVSTGGFSTQNASFGAFSPALQWACVVFMAIGATSFLLLWQICRGRLRALRRNTEFHVFCWVMVLSSVGIGLFLSQQQPHAPVEEIARASAFQVVSIVTTTGFGTADYQQWPNFCKVVLFMLMVIGGCSGSTAGGAKIIRMVVGFRVGLLSIERSFRLRVIRQISVNGRNLDDDARAEIMTFIGLLAFVAALGLVLLGLLEPNLSLEGTIAAVVATLFNIGPGFAEVGPASNYSGLGPASHLLLSLMMILGRLELYAILVLFSPSLWRRFS
jgi:trk system potassium uptake protein